MTVIVMSGDPLTGFRHYGPFHDTRAALDWAERTMPNELWWAISLISPEDQR